MKKIYECNGYKVYETTICGFPCNVHKSVHSGCTVQVPFGKTKREKEMFDDLVYNKKAYYGNTPKEAIRKVSEFIINYK